MNKLPPIVRNQPRQSQEDARVHRTRRQLIEAMFALVREEGYLGFAVADLLERAGVARSTFYKHYRSKDDLLFQSFAGMLRMLDQPADHSDRPFAIRELFVHVGEALPFHQALKRANRLERLYARGVETVTSLIASRAEVGDGDAQLRARMFAGALFALLAWWVEAGRNRDPAEMEEMLLSSYWRGAWARS